MKSYDELFRKACEIFTFDNQNFQNCVQMEQMRAINAELTKRFERGLMNISLSSKFYDLVREARIGGKTPREIVAELEAINNTL